MARMHTGKHGKSKSRKPHISEETPLAEPKIPKEEIMRLISEYSSQGTRPELIGQYLKDKHGVPYLRKALGKKLMQFMEEKKLAGELPPDLLNLMRKAVSLRKHLSTNKQDVHNRTRLIRTESKIWRLGKYYKKEGRLPLNWKYDPVQAALITKD